MKLPSVLTLMMICLTLSLPACQKVDGETQSGEHEAAEHHALHKILVTSPLAKDIVNIERYVCQIHSRRHIEVCALEGGYLEEILVKEGQVINYQRTVLNAFTEVINRMSKVDNYGKSLDIKRQQLAALKASVVAATQLFQAGGRVGYVDVLLAQRDMQDAKMEIIETKKQQLTAVVGFLSSPRRRYDAELQPGPGHDLAIKPERPT